MKNFICLVSALFLLGLAFSCKKAENNSVIIYTSTEDFRTEHMQGRTRRILLPIELTFRRP